MQDFVHLHVHTQYSVLDGQAAVPKLVDKAIGDGMRGMAITDHGNMMGIKEFFNYTQKVCGKAKGKVKEAEEKLKALRDGTYTPRTDKDGNDPDAGKSTEQLIAETEKTLAKQQRIAHFKPIFGCEMYVARRGDKRLKEQRVDQSGWHLVVLAKNEHGYHNLIKLVSRAWVDGFYMRPRTDFHDLEEFHEDLIVCSACLGGELPQKIMHDDMAGAEKTVAWFKRVFGDDYYLELQRHEVKDPAIRANRDTFKEQERVNPILLELGQKMGVKCICTNDCHFVDEENAEAHDRLICLSTGRDLDDPNRMLYTKQEWFKTQAEMNAVFADLPEVLANTCEICDKIETYSIDHAPIMPNFAIPEDFGTEEGYRAKYTEQDLFEEFTRDENGNVVMSEEDGMAKIKKLGGFDKLYRIKLEADYLAKLAYEGAHKRYGEHLDAETEERIKFELHIMKTMGFPGYFLIVQDYIRAAREDLGVSVGPGRGSAAGSAVAYCLGITQIDPIQYDLLFERFLNPDRISLPDIDVDFDDDGRGKVLNWVTQKYGADNVAHIITYGTMATKLALKDVARVQKLPLSTSNALCKLIPDKLPEGPDGKTPKMNLPNAIAAIPELREAETSNDPLLRDTIRYAKMLEGNVRNTGVHACGFIICRDNISDWVPVSTARDKETGEELHCTQYEGKVIEETGLIKMDFLGLKTLSIIKETVENIKLSLGIDLDIDAIDINDPATYQLYCDGNTVGTFQFESPGMQKYLRELQPSTFEDLIAMNALYRPGPMQYIPQFIARKHGKEPITYDLPCMEKYLKDTYGITVYQEQVMLLSREIADFTRGESDALRKAMGKKLIEKLNHMYPKFIKGGTANGHDPKVLEKIWDDWRAFASYAFNKSHATCYSWVAYQTAYLKANYPSQYMAGVMSRSLADISTVSKLMDECKTMGINTLRPDINESYLKFSVNHLGDIRFGLGAIKGVGEGAVADILRERKANGPFKSIYDFVERVNLSSCNRKNMECLGVAGAFDCFEDLQREHFVAGTTSGECFLDALMQYGINYQQDKATCQMSLFGPTEMPEIAKPAPQPVTERWGDMERLNRERELLGIYISGHPLDEYAIVLQNVCTAQMAEMADLSERLNQDITFGGIVTSVKRGQTKRGNPYGIVRIEDFSGPGEVPLFGDEWARWSGYMTEGNPVYITARVSPKQWRPEEWEVRIGKIEFLPDVKDNILKSITINVDLDELTTDNVARLTELLHEEDGPTEVFINVVDKTRSMQVTLQSMKCHLTVKHQLINYLDHEPALSFKIN
ncbi:MAG: DNA polymerase III subunit alpha [Prevotellamassilia sp.]|nr:DNA polymerase III subunit alpha [Prevotellamassilia sp.]